MTDKKREEILIGVPSNLRPSFNKLIDLIEESGKSAPTKKKAEVKKETEEKTKTKEKEIK